MASRRRVIRGGNRSFKDRLKQLGLSFTSYSRFKRYWLSAAGARRIGTVVGAGVLVVVLVFAYFAKDLPSPSKINAQIGSENTVFYDRTNTVKIYEVHGDKNRTVIDFNQMPQGLRDATIAVEDKNFYHEGAFSFFSILRVAFFDLIHHGAYEGASTITQQYVKNALLDPTDHTFTRKVKELILSLEIEQLYKKDDILKLYLNEIPYGSEAYGVEAACRTFFPADDPNPTQTDPCAAHLTLAQSATLAAMENLPTYYSPYGEHIGELRDRQNLVLDLMVQQHLVSQQAANAAKILATTGDSQLTSTDLQQQLALAPAPQIQTAVSPYPHFALYAQEYLESKYGANTVENGGLHVITSLDITKQTEMQNVIQNDPNGIKSVRANQGSNIAMVTADPKTGQVLAMMGSYDPNDPNFGAFNVALADRQPGSSFKPFVYSQIMKGDWGAGSTLYDVKTNFGSTSNPYIPKNYSGLNYGVQSVRTALDGSLNIPAVKVLYMAGIQNSINNAHAMGITTLNQPASDYGLSLVLGSGGVELNQMVNGYETFANGGYHYPATPILKVTDPHGHVLEDNSKPPTPKRVLDPQIAYILDNILSDNKARAFIFGTNNPLHINGRTVAAKTGTTENYNDAWTMGYSPDLVTGVWVGNNNDASMDNEAVDIAAPIWHDYMAGWYDAQARQQVPGALAGYPVTDSWSAPQGIQTLTLDANTGGPVTSRTRTKRTDIFPSWYKIPSRCAMTAEIPSTDPEYPNWEPPVAALAGHYGYSSYSTGSCTASGAAATQPVAPNPDPSVRLSVTGSTTLQISTTVTAGAATPTQLELYDNGQLIDNQSLNGVTSYSTTYTPPSPGSHTIKAIVTDTSGKTGEESVTVNVAGSTSGSSPPGQLLPSSPGQ